MATLTKRGEYQWQAKIRRKGLPVQSKTFDTKADAEAWARQIEHEMDRGVFLDRREAESTMLAEALSRYQREVTPSKKGAAREVTRILALIKHPIASRALASVRTADIASYRDERRNAGKAENTIRLELLLLSQVFKVAAIEWGIPVQNPVSMVKLPTGSKARSRRLLPGEEAYLWDAIEIVAPNNFVIKKCCQFAIETGMRQSEILGLDWDDVELDRRVAHLLDTKNSDPRDVPMTTRAVQILQLMDRKSAKHIFPVSQDYLIRTFAKALLEARKNYEADCLESKQRMDVRMCRDLRFHDLRHEAASRMASKLAAHELAKIMGWRTLQMAMRYYHPTAEDLALKLG